MTNKDYKRLTANGTLQTINELAKQVYDRLKDLEDAIENQELIFIPKLGTPFWYLEYERGCWFIKETVVSDVLYSDVGIFFVVDINDALEGFLPPERVYFSLETANKALKEKQKWEEEHHGE